MWYNNYNNLGEIKRMSNIKIFEDKKVRVEWDEANEDWLFSLVDVVEILTDSVDPTQYLKRLRSRDIELNDYMGTNCTHVEMVGKTGKKRKLLAGRTKDVLRLIQSIPSKKAEPFKMWLAQVGSERLDEIADPQKAIDRGIDFYRKKGYPEDWITQRMFSIKTRKELTNEWQERGITQEKEYAILTNELTKAWSGLTVQEYKNLKSLKKENLRDNMTDIELVLNMLAEVTTTGLSKQQKPQTLEESKTVARQGGNVAKNARKEYEDLLGQPVVTSKNANNKNLLVEKNNK